MRLSIQVMIEGTTLVVEGDRSVQSVVGVDHAGARLDVFLAVASGIRSRNQAQKIIAAGEVTINGVVGKKKTLLCLGDLVEYYAPASEVATVSPETIPLKIVFEDESVIVVDKVAGMVVHPGVDNYSGTLVNALLAHTKLASPGAPLRPGIVHRLDKGTSGLMVAAKTDSAYFSLVEQLKTRQMHREYLALVEGGFDDLTGRIEASLRRSPKNRLMMEVGGQGAKEAFTNFRVLETEGGLSLLAVKLETGRTHQIRAHMRFIQHPLVGDEVYGRAATGARLGLDRPWLHARKLTFSHPEDGREVSLAVAIPEDLRKALDKAGLSLPKDT